MSENDSIHWRVAMLCDDVAEASAAAARWREGVRLDWSEDSLRLYARLAASWAIMALASAETVSQQMT